MTGYTKLFSSIIASTIWRSSDHTRLVWITMLAMADRHGVVEASVPGLADMSRVSVEQCREAIVELQQPDADSRSTEREGRRIEPVDGGWLLINHGKYRDKMSADDRREYNKLYQRKRRQVLVNNVAYKSTESRHTEAEAEAEATTAAVRTASLRSDAAAAYLDINNLATAWNFHTTAPIPRCRELSPARRKQIAARLKERPMSSWREVFTRINASPFCRGETERGHWKASFDWIIANADNAIKVLEGKYDRQTTPPKSVNADVLRDFVNEGTER